MNSKALLAGIACMASAVMVDARESQEMVDSEPTDEKTSSVVHRSQQETKMDLLLSVLKTRIN